VESFFDPGEKPGIYGLLHLGLPYAATILGFIASILIQLGGEPFWLPEIMAGLLLGWFAFETVPSKTAFLAWIVPAGCLLWSVWSLQHTTGAHDSTWNTYFGSDCGGSECLYQLLLTAPFYSSVFYSIGALSRFIVARVGD
jgi:hypothetical protein